MTKPAPAQLREIGQIAIPVQDVARAVRFYRDTLGMPLLFEAPPGLAFFDCGSVRLMLSAAGPDAEGAPVHRAAFSDSEDNMLALMSEVRPPEPQ